jgi:hypothetical protein
LKRVASEFEQLAHQDARLPLADRTVRFGWTARACLGNDQANGKLSADSIRINDRRECCAARMRARTQ